MLGKDKMGLNNRASLAEKRKTQKRTLWLGLMLGTLLFVAVLAPQAGYAGQKCNDSILAGRSGANFFLHEDGTVTDNTTGLMWMRCALGQEWKGDTCRIAAFKFSWVEALKTADSHQFAGFSDWRLPNKNQLSSIVEERCVSPAIDAKIFPATATTFFWTSSPYAGLPTAAWSVDFGYGVITSTEKSGVLPVRLVRGEE